MTQKESGPGTTTPSLTNADQPSTSRLPHTLYTARDLGDWYCLGVEHERERAAGALHELDTVWTRSGTEVAESRYAEMMRTFEEAAHRFHRRELGKAYTPFQGVAT